MEKSMITAAIWPWGTDKREQMVTASQEVSEIGYSSFESVRDAIYAYDLDLAAYEEVLKKYGLNAASFYFHFPVIEESDKIFDNLDRELDFISALGVRRICLQATWGRPETMDDAKKDQQVKLVEKFALWTKKIGITTNIHNHHNTWVMYEDEIDYILQNLGPGTISFAPDTAHLVAGLCDPVHTIKKYLDRVNFIHLKDIKDADIKSAGLASAGMEVYSNFCELGQGIVDFKQIFDLLKSADYDGPLCEELDKAPVNNALSAMKNYDYILKHYFLKT